MKYVLLAPGATLCALFVVWPVGELVKMSLSDGAQNYLLMFSDADFGRSIINSLIYTALLVPLQVGVALVVALNAVNLSKRGQDMARFAFYIPFSCAGIVVAVIWKWVFHVNGPVNWMLRTRIDFLANRWTAIPAVSIATAAAMYGVIIALFLAALIGIDPALYDAAKIDGASPRQIRWRVMAPAIMPVVWMYILLAAIAAPQVIEYVLALAPHRYGATMAYDIYETAWLEGQHGAAAAKAIVLFAWLMFLMWGKTRLSHG